VSIELSLERQLVAMIAAEGPIGVDRYMGLCLGHVRHGYYMRQDPFGRAGDFTTAPEISQMFGELIGVWCAAAWQAMGAPAPLRLVELGPGRGTLMADFLRAARIVPGFLDAASVALVETSPVLRQSQKETLASAGVPIQWHDRLDDVAPGPTLLVANEFLDALGVRQFVRTDTGWHERLVGLDASGKLAFGLAPDAVPADLLPRWAQGAGPGEIFEVSPARQIVAQAIGARLATMGGAALIIDYGHVRSSPGDTLQAVRAHAFRDVLENPGDSDLTSHVDFEALGAALHQGGAVVHGPLTQGAFLSAMGLAERAEALKRHADASARADIDAAATRLAADSQMGQLFKVIAATHPDLPPPYPFQDPGS
jgi:NADH dehydrogenase [ubiquinone] 1 alpha subcomplex assembly factor 7